MSRLLFLFVLVLVGGATCTTSETAGEASAADTTQADTTDAVASDTLTMDALATLADTLSPSEAARYAFHGRDLKGKDGPMARIGYDLAHLYFAYRAYREAPSGTFEPPGQARVDEGRVLIDATASENGDLLRADLDRLGLEGGATAGPVVGGRLPIEALPDASQLESLRSMRPSRPATHR